MRTLSTTSSRLALALLTLALSTGCSFKATLDQTMDTTSNVSGTTSSVHSWVSEDGLVKPDYKALALIAASRENMEQNIAAGSGEYLTAVGTLLGVPEPHRADFGAAVQRRYAQNWPDSHAAPEQWLAQLHQTAQPYRLPH
ncbi:MAG: DUF3015 domain-containing protein [Nitrospiraceae bacterium]|jgi:uncharacterized protein YdbL (DUF1318 family)|nr:DUF3015 domain-containing protein [Nitrospiraceae bacterium]OQW63072.1 MAG: hypothetical protein BVN29_17955 [Nitrospira sp. ST-bin5]